MFLYINHQKKTKVIIQESDILTADQIYFQFTKIPATKSVISTHNPEWGTPESWEQLIEGGKNEC